MWMEVEQRMRRVDKAQKAQRSALGPVLASSTDALVLPPEPPISPRGNCQRPATTSNSQASPLWRTVEELRRRSEAEGVDPADWSAWQSAFLKGDVQPLPKPRPRRLPRRRSRLSWPLILLLRLSTTVEIEPWLNYFTKAPSKVL